MHTLKPLLKSAGRGFMKALLQPMLTWDPIRNPESGFSIVLAVPWEMRGILCVNLEFVKRTNLQDLRSIQIVFDRTRRDGAEDFIEQTRSRFPALPLSFSFLGPISGRVAEAAKSVDFFCGSCWTQGLARVTTRYAVVHDFDLYPLSRDYFTRIVDRLNADQFKFAGNEHTAWGGWGWDAKIIGTWALGIDVAWLRENYSPIDCFHREQRYEGRLVKMNPFTHLQSQTPERGLVASPTRDTYCHVNQLCCLYFELAQGRCPPVAWRLHYLWYLKYLAGDSVVLLQVTEQMNGAKSSTLVVKKITIDYSVYEVTCASFLRGEISAMERTLHGIVRPEVEEYLSAFEQFLGFWGKSGGHTANTVSPSRKMLS